MMLSFQSYITEKHLVKPFLTTAAIAATVGATMIPKAKEIEKPSVTQTITQTPPTTKTEAPKEKTYHEKFHDNHTPFTTASRIHS